LPKRSNVNEVDRATTRIRAEPSLWRISDAGIAPKRVRRAGVAESEKNGRGGDGAAAAAAAATKAAAATGGRRDLITGRPR
jgi:hypothetical protein